MNIATAPIPLRRTAKLNGGLFDELIVDNFAGGGGASKGIEAAVGRSVDIAVNHDQDAVRTHQLNHPYTRHLCESVWDVDPVEVTRGRKVGLAWFSPDCTHFSRAKGGKPVKKRIRGLAWVVIRWAKLVAPRVIILENVREFQTWGPLAADHKPCPTRKGQTFKRWVSQLRNLGYSIEWRELNAADYGAPTHRRRFFLVARNDGRPITWPEPTHGTGRRSYRTAAECIDWNIPCPSIFLTKTEAKPLGIIRPLAPKTMRRIALGLKRYVIDNPKPFIVKVQHGGNDFRRQAVGEPLQTITEKHGTGVVVPSIVGIHHSGKPFDGQAIDVPLRTITATPKGGSFALMTPYIAGVGGRAGQTPPTSGDAPVGTITAKNDRAVVVPFLAKHYGGVGHGPERPLGTVTAVDHHSVVASHLTKFYGTNIGSEADAPLPVVTGSGNHIGEVRAFLCKYYGQGCGQECAEPLHTVTGNDRFGLVTVAGEPYQIVDIGMRMLSPRELLRAQFGKYAKDYVLTGPKRLQVKLIGNSVCPQMAEALVRANYSEKAEVAA